MDYHNTPSTLTPLLTAASNSSGNSQCSNSMISNCPNLAATGYLPKGSTELEPLNPLAYSGAYGNSSATPAQSTNNSWSTMSGYNSYPSCGSGQYSATPTMVLYPQLYSTVNQNQIHLHLHATASTDKIEQYLGTSTSTLVEHSSSAPSVSSLPAITASERVEIGIGTSDNNNLGNDNSYRDQEMEDRSGEGGNQTDLRGSGATQDNRDAIITSESVWRPY